MFVCGWQVHGANGIRFVCSISANILTNPLNDNFVSWTVSLARWCSYSCLEDLAFCWEGLPCAASCSGPAGLLWWALLPISEAVWC